MNNPVGAPTALQTQASVKSSVLLILALLMLSQYVYAASDMTDYIFNISNQTAASTYSITVIGKPDVINLLPGQSYNIDNLPKTGVKIDGTPLADLILSKQKCGFEGRGYCLTILDPAK